jgi:iron complex outermembrane receptor protein
MKKIILLAMVFAPLYNVFSQTVNGNIIDSITNKPVAFANILVIEIDLGVKADTEGNFSIQGKLPEKFTLKISALGYQTYILAQSIQTWKDKILLNPKHVELDEITVSGPQSSLQRENAIRIETRKLSELNSISNLNLGESLAQIPGVYNTSTGNAIAKPVVRGLQGIRVVSLLNGLRIENQQWGGDHGIGLTDLGIGTVEIIKGPASLLYGADALGGVIYYVDEAYAPQGKSELGFQTLNFSNTLGTVNKFQFKRSTGKSRFAVYGSYSNHADYQLSSGRFAENSRFSDYNLKLSYGINSSNWAMQVRYTLNGSRIGIPGHTHDSIIDFASFQSTERGRKLRIPVQIFMNNLLSVENKFFTKRGEINLLLGQTVNRLTEFEEKNTIPGIDMFLSNSLYHLKWKYSITERLSLVSGIQGMFQWIKNTNIGTEALLPNAFMLDNGVYSVFTYHQKKWSIQTGLRMDQRIVKSISEFNGISSLNRNFESVNFSAGWVRPSEYHTYRINVSSGFRSPHLSELMSNGLHHGTLRYEIGDVNLKNERATQIDLSYELQNEHFQLIINPFYNYIDNFITITPSDSFVDGLPVFFYKQKPLVHLYGSDLSLHYHPHFAHWLHLESSFSMVQAEDNLGNDIALIPQNRISSNVKFSFNERPIFYIEEIVLQHQFFAEQNRVAVYETSSSAYHLLNISCNMKWNLNSPIYIGVGVKNILNEVYIDHLSRLKNIQMPHPGRNFYVSLKINLTTNNK